MYKHGFIHTYLLSNSLIIISLAIYGVYSLHCAQVTALSLNEAT